MEHSTPGAMLDGRRMDREAGRSPDEPGAMEGGAVPVQQSGVRGRVLTDAEFAELFRAHSPDVLRFVKAMGLRGDEAADAVSETFLVLRDKIRDENLPANMGGKLTRIAVNVV